jgi:hypothetical protein
VKILTAVIAAELDHMPAERDKYHDDVLLFSATSSTENILLLLEV